MTFQCMYMIFVLASASYSVFVYFFTNWTTKNCYFRFTCTGYVLEYRIRVMNVELSNKSRFLQKKRGHRSHHIEKRRTSEIEFARIYYQNLHSRVFVFLWEKSNAAVRLETHRNSLSPRSFKTILRVLFLKMLTKVVRKDWLVMQ